VYDACNISHIMLLAVFREFPPLYLEEPTISTYKNYMVRGEGHNERR